MKEVLKLVEDEDRLRISEMVDWAASLNDAADHVRAAWHMEASRQNLEGLDADDRVTGAAAELKAAVIRSLQTAVAVLRASGYLGKAVGNNFVSEIGIPDLPMLVIDDAASEKEAE